MSPGTIRKTVVAERVAWIGDLLSGIRALPLSSLEEFLSDPRNVAAAESYLRRALEALHDLGRHLLAKGFGEAVTEYKAVATGLLRRGVLDAAEAGKLGLMAGYRNRMVHFYAEISPSELYGICTGQLADIDELLAALVGWFRAHPDKLDDSL